MGQDSFCHEAKFSWWTEIWTGGEEARSGTERTSGVSLSQ